MLKKENLSTRPGFQVTELQLNYDRWGKTSSKWKCTKAKAFLAFPELLKDKNMKLANKAVARGI